MYYTVIEHLISGMGGWVGGWFSEWMDGWWISKWRETGW